jgi:hypothetical protein
MAGGRIQAQLKLALVLLRGGVEFVTVRARAAIHSYCVMIGQAAARCQLRYRLKFIGVGREPAPPLTAYSTGTGLL